MKKEGSPIPDLNNPTDEERHELLENLLRLRGRPEDLPDIISLFSPPEDITTLCPPGYAKGKNIKVAVLGGGISGFTSAYELRKLGVDVTLFEASDRFGGRIYTHYLLDDKKYPCELGAMRISPAHECVWHYIYKFKLPTRPFVYKNLNGFTYIKGVRIQGDIQGRETIEKIYPKFDLMEWERTVHWGQLLDYTLGRPIQSLTSEERKDIISVKKDYSYNYNFLCQFSLRQMLRRGYLSEGGIDLVCSFNPFLRYLQPFSYSETLHDEYPVHFSQLFEFVNHFDSLIYAFKDALESPTHFTYKESESQLGKVLVKKKSPVKKIVWAENGTKVDISWNENDVDKTDSFDFVVNTIPFTILRNIYMTPLKENIVNQAIKELNYTDATKVFMLFKHRFWEDLDIQTGISLTDLCNTHVYYPTDHYFQNKMDPDEPGVLIACYNLALEATKLGALDEKMIIEIMTRNLEEIHGLPEGTLAPLVLDYKICHWNSEDWLGGALTFFQPGQKRIFLEPLTRAQYDGHMYFAGEHVSTTHGWIQGSIESSLRASNRIAKIIKKRY